MSTGPAWRVFKTVSLRSQLYVPPSARRDPATLIECCVRVLGANVQAQYKRIKLLPYEVQDFVFECAREEVCRRAEAHLIANRMPGTLVGSAARRFGPAAHMLPQSLQV